MKGVSAVGAALLAVSVGLVGCKSKGTYVLVTILPAAGGEPAPITDLELDTDLAGKTTTLHLSDPGHAPLTFPTTVTLQAKSGAGQLVITVIARNAAGAEVDRATSTLTVAASAITDATVQLPGGKPDLQPSETSHDFGALLQGVASSPVTITFRNVGFKPSGVISVALGGLGASAWTIGTNTCSGTTLAPSATCTVSLQFDPLTIGALASTLTVSANPGGAPAVALTGTGTANPQTLTVTLAGSGGGSVVSSETPTPKISCSDSTGVPQSGTCTATYAYGSTVTLMATADGVSFFNGGSIAGAPPCSGNPCTFTMTNAVSATVNLEHNPVPVNVIIAGAGTGTVTDSATNFTISSGTGVDNVTYGAASVTLTAARQNSFQTWGGDCSSAGAAATCTLNGPITTAFNVTATFTSSCAAAVTVEQAFGAMMQGCAGAVTYANRATLCGPGAHVCNANEWVQGQGGTAPTHDYWTDDALNYSSAAGACGTAGCGPGNCFVTTGNTYTFNCGATTPMRVCTATGTDTEGNSCNWTGCGFNSISPNQYFGGCSGNTTAGTLCCFGQHQYFVNASTGSDSNPGTSASPFKTVTHALGVAVSGDTVFVKPGVYNRIGNAETFPLIVPSGVALIGDEPNRGGGGTPTTLIGLGLANGSTFIGAVVVPGAGATVAGFTITTTPPPSGQFGEGIYPSASGAIIRNNTITGNNDDGVYVNVAGSTNHLVVLNSITNNTNFGLVNRTTQGGKAENNTITGNGFGVDFETGGGGIDLGGGPANSVGNNIISCNAINDLWTDVNTTISASNNKWDHSPPTVSTTGTSADINNANNAATITTTGSTLAPSPCSRCGTSAVSSQAFDQVMTGCGAPGAPAAIIFGSRASLCISGGGCHACTAAEWVSHHGTAGPNVSYWTGDATLGFVSGPTNNCEVSTTSGLQAVCNNEPAAGDIGAMLVCPAGNVPGTTTPWCQESGCGLDNFTPAFFGGCSQSSGSIQWNQAAGTLCCCP